MPPFEVFDTVTCGAAEMGNGADYWKCNNEAFQFFSSVPFGLTADEMNAWLYHGGGMALWRQAYAPFDIVPMAIGNSGVQMGSWFNKEIRSVDNDKGDLDKVQDEAEQKHQRHDRKYGRQDPAREIREDLMYLAHSPSYARG